MPVFEKTHGSEVLLRGVDRRVSVGDRVDVDGGFADYLSERDDFTAVDETDPESERPVDAGEADDEEDDAFDVDAFLDRTPVDDVANDIQAGDVDDHLDAVAEAADRVTVQDAVGQRRAELAEEE